MTNEPKRPPGRPKSDNPLTEHIEGGVDKATKKAFVAKCFRLGVTQAEGMRRAIANWVRGEGEG